MNRKKYTKEFLEPLVKKHTSITGILKELNLKLTGGSFRLISQRIKESELDTSHFTGQGWAKGLTHNTNKSIAASRNAKRIPDKDVFKKNSGYPPSKLFNRLVQIGWKQKCSNEKCGLTSWLGEPIRLHVDHINGDHCDHRLENLRFLCPNCHQQTKTWGNRSKS